MTDSILRSYQHQSFTSMVPYPVVVFTGILDTYPGAKAGYSFRRLKGTATAAVRIRRSSDNTEQDIGWDSSGNFDTAAASSFIGGGSGFIVTWYDQSGNVNVTQTTAANQPAYAATGINSGPAIQFTAASSQVLLADAASNETDFGVMTNMTIFNVNNINSSNSNQILYRWGTGSTNMFACYYGPSTDFEFFFSSTSSTIQVNVTPYDDADAICELFRDSGDNQTILVNGTSLGSAVQTSDTTSASQVWAVGASPTLGSFSTGFQTELLIWGSDLGSTTRTAIRTDLNTYYTVF